MAPRPVKPIRVRKARRNGNVSGCGHWAKYGETIISVNGAPWICLSCRRKQKAEEKA